MRSCRTCERYLVGDNGEVATHPGRYDDDGEVVMVPSERPPQCPPPCRVCPKWDGRDGTPKPLGESEDLFGGSWLPEVRQAFLEGRAVGDLGGADPFMRSVYAELDQAERRLERLRSQSALSAALVHALASARR